MEMDLGTRRNSCGKKLGFFFECEAPGKFEDDDDAKK